MLLRYCEKKCPLRLDADHRNIFHILTSRRYDTGFFRERVGTDGHDGGCFRDSIMQKGIAQEMGFLTEDDVAHLFNVSKSTLDNWRRNSTGPAYAYAGNSFFYPVRGVSAFLMDRVKGFGFTHGGAL